LLDTKRVIQLNYLYHDSCLFCNPEGNQFIKIHVCERHIGVLGRVISAWQLVPASVTRRQPGPRQQAEAPTARTRATDTEERGSNERRDCITLGAHFRELVSKAPVMGVDTGPGGVQ